MPDNVSIDWEEPDHGVSERLYPQISLNCGFSNRVIMGTAHRCFTVTVSKPNLTRGNDQMTIKETNKLWKEKLATDVQWACRGMVRVWEYQTADEQNTQVTNQSNGVGFTGSDAFILTSFADQVNAGRKMSVKQMQIIFKKMPKYAGQLQRIVKQEKKDAEQLSQEAHAQVEPIQCAA